MPVPCPRPRPCWRHNHAPHITRIAAMHPEIEEIGHHCRDYFVRQWERFRHVH